MFVPKNDKVTGDWRKFHNEELHHFVFVVKYYWYDRIKEDEICGTCSPREREQKCVQNFGGKTLRKGTIWKILLKQFLKE
jgi:hypothetical protein